MPELPNIAVAVFVGLVCFVAQIYFYRLGLRVGRDRQRVLSSRLGHGLRPAPSALLFDPADFTHNKERRDSSGVCSDRGAAPKTVVSADPQLGGVFKPLVTHDA